MKRYLCLLLSVSCMFSFAACGTPGPASVPTPDAPEVSASEAPQSEPPEESTPWPPGTSETEQVVLSIPVEAVSEGNVPEGSVMPYYYSIEGLYMGPDEFDIEDGRIYILNTASNSVSVFYNGVLERTADLSAAGLRGGVHMAVDGGIIYIFGIEDGTLAPAFAAIYPDGTVSALPFVSSLPSEAVASMSAKDGKLYVEVSGQMLIFDTANPDARRERVPDGKHMLSDGTLWEPRTIPEDKIASSTMALDITLPDGESLTLNFESSCEDALLGGLRLLRHGGGQYDVYAVEIGQNADYVIYTAEYILRVDSDGTPLGVYSGDTSQFLYSTRSDAGALYGMGVTDEAVTIKRLPDVYPTAWADYVSPLDGISTTS